MDKQSSFTRIWNLLTTKEERIGLQVTIMKLELLNQLLLFTFVIDHQCNFEFMLNIQRLFQVCKKDPVTRLMAKLSSIWTKVAKCICVMVLRNSISVFQAVIKLIKLVLQLPVKGQTWETIVFLLIIPILHNRYIKFPKCTSF